MTKTLMIASLKRSIATDGVFSSIPKSSADKARTGSGDHFQRDLSSTTEPQCKSERRRMRSRPRTAGEIAHKEAD